MKLTPKKIKPVKEEVEKDWEADFDFSIYEQEATEKPIETIKDLKRPGVTGLRSRFSNGQAELERLAELNTLISKHSIIVAARTAEVAKLWEYYAILDEFWESIRNLYGEHLNTEMGEEKIMIEGLLEEQSKRGGKIHPSLHKHLLKFRSRLYRLKQLGNLGFEVEHTMRSGFSRSQSKITQ